MRLGPLATFAAQLSFAVFPLIAAAEPFPVERSDGAVKLSFTSRAESAGCAFGEINAFSRELAQGPKSFRLLLSLEPLGSGELPSRRADIGRFDLKKPFTSSFSYPPFSKRSYFMLSICSDWDRLDRCAGKPLVSLDSYFGGNDPKTKKIKLGGEERKDEIFYFAVLALENEGGEIISSRALPADMRRALKEAGASDEKLNEIDRALELYPVPIATTSPSGLVLTFRYRDFTKCK